MKKGERKRLLEKYHNDMIMADTLTGTWVEMIESKDYEHEEVLWMNIACELYSQISLLKEFSDEIVDMLGADCEKFDKKQFQLMIQLRKDLLYVQ